MKKVSQRRKKFERGTPWDFSIPSLSQNPKKLRGDPLGNFFSEKKSRNTEKTERWDPLVSSGIVCYAVNFVSVPWANR